MTNKHKELAQSQMGLINITL